MNQPERKGKAMRLLDAMTPAKSREEAAMLPARMRTVSQGAALESVRERREVKTVDVPVNKNTAAEKTNKVVLLRRRAALQHVLKRQFACDTVLFSGQRAELHRRRPDHRR